MRSINTEGRSFTADCATMTESWRPCFPCSTSKATRSPPSCVGLASTTASSTSPITVCLQSCSPKCGLEPGRSSRGPSKRSSSCISRKRKNNAATSRFAPRARTRTPWATRRKHSTLLTRFRRKACVMPSRSHTGCTARICGPAPCQGSALPSKATSTR